MLAQSNAVVDVVNIVKRSTKQKDNADMNNIAKLNADMTNEKRDLENDNKFIHSLSSNLKQKHADKLQDLQNKQVHEKNTLQKHHD